MRRQGYIILLISGNFIPLFLTSCFGDIIRDPHSLPYDSTSFNRLADRILKQDQIFQLDDFSRYYKNVNRINIRLTKESNGEYNHTTYIDSLTDSLRIDKALLNELRYQLEKTKLREFYRSTDSILFRVDGFLSSSWGFLYSRKSLTPDTMFFKFGEYWIHYVYDVNDHWKKVAITP